MKVNNRPLPERTADTILMMIHKENLTAGMRLPNEHELAARLEVSRSTVRAAIRILAERNILRTERGCGTFVSDKFGLSGDPLGLSAVYDVVGLFTQLYYNRLPQDKETLKQYMADMDMPLSIQELGIEGTDGQLKELEDYLIDSPYVAANEESYALLHEAMKQMSAD